MTQDLCREAFEAAFAKNALDFTMTKDAWDRPIYLHPHVRSMFTGFEAAWSQRVPEGMVVVPADVMLKRRDTGHLTPDHAICYEMGFSDCEKQATLFFKGDA